jgi:hypothetical protein
LCDLRPKPIVASCFRHRKLRMRSKKYVSHRLSRVLAETARVHRCTEKEERAPHWCVEERSRLTRDPNCGCGGCGRLWMRNTSQNCIFMRLSSNWRQSDHGKARSRSEQSVSTRFGRSTLGTAPKKPNINTAPSRLPSLLLAIRTHLPQGLGVSIRGSPWRAAS